MTRKSFRCRINLIEVVITVEVDPTGNGDWMEYAAYAVQPGERFVQQLPEAFQARWIRLCRIRIQATAWLDYNKM